MGFGKHTEGNSKSLTFGNMPFVWVSCQHSNVGHPGYEAAVQKHLTTMFGSLMFGNTTCKTQQPQLLKHNV